MRSIGGSMAPMKTQVAAKARRLLFTGLFVAGVAVMPATAAQASISACHGQYNSAQTWAVHCLVSNPSSFRAVATCSSIVNDTWYWKFGAWRTTDGWSYVNCPSGYEVGDGSWDD